MAVELLVPDSLQTNPTAILQINGLQFRWPGQTQPTLVVNQFAIQAGEQVFLHGESGSGKSTLLAVVAGIHSQYEGDVTLLGKVLKRLNQAGRDRHRAQHLGIIFQQFNLLPYLNVLENVLLAQQFYKTHAVKSAGDEAARLLQALDVSPTLFYRQANQLSVGQQQRVAAARALFARPALIMADEPTSSLDQKRQLGFLDLLLNQVREFNCAVLFVSHDLRLAERFEKTISMQELNRVHDLDLAHDLNKVHDLNAERDLNRERSVNQGST